MIFDPDAFGVTEHSEHFLKNAEETRAFGASLAQDATPGSFYGFIGQLGAGKTTMLQGFLPAIDPTQAASDVTSPTYALLNVYRSTPPVYHFDLYRLTSVDDLESVGYWDYVEADGISCVEWLDQVPGAWPHDAGQLRVIVTIEPKGEGRCVRVYR